MTKAITHTYSVFFEFRRQITMALTMLCVLTALIYAANLYRVISHTIALQDTSSQMASVNASIDVLDGQYLSVSRTITPDTVTAHGFDNGKVSAFISRTTSLGRVTMAGNGL